MQPSAVSGEARDKAMTAPARIEAHGLQACGQHDASETSGHRAKGLPFWRAEILGGLRCEPSSVADVASRDANAGREDHHEERRSQREEFRSESTCRRNFKSLFLRCLRCSVVDLFEIAFARPGTEWDG